MFWTWYDDVIKWKLFQRYWPFVRGIHRSPVNSPHKGQWRGALTFSFICCRINGWVNNRWAGDLRRRRAHYDVIVMNYSRVPLSVLIPAAGHWLAGIRLFHIPLHSPSNRQFCLPLGLVEAWQNFQPVIWAHDALQRTNNPLYMRVPQSVLRPANHSSGHASYLSVLSDSLLTVLYIHRVKTQ